MSELPRVGCGGPSCSRVAVDATNPAPAVQAEPAPLVSSSKRLKAGKRFQRSNKMIAELLRLRFEDAQAGECSTQDADALTLQNCASVLSQSLGVIITREQCLYRKEKRESELTGSFTRPLREIDDSLWVILHDAFAGRHGISG
ncbi:hypothetical protein GN958_ATG20265, partial [Phytophthora infestans]